MAAAELQCRSLTFRRGGGARVIDDLTASFGAGHPCLVTGPTGAGKSTLLHLMAGLLRPTGGEILADGEPVSRWSAYHRDIWRRQAGIVFQHLHLLNDLSVAENVLLPGIPRAVAWNDLKRRSEELLARFDLSEVRHEPLRTLSGGQRQRVAWARAMVLTPRYLLLDEPTSFQDDVYTRGLLEAVANFTNRNACVIISSHDIRLRRSTGLFYKIYRLSSGTLEVDA